MSEFTLITPVAFIIFNRPDVTQLVFEEIRKARPKKLLVIADGPCLNKTGEAERCVAARAIIERVDWDCEVLKNYSNVNLGCGKRVSTGLDWVFNIVEEAIILEDDCLPHPTFFRFCQELLEKYRDDERVLTISGNNFQFGRRRTDYSYYFSRYDHIWGWATWRRMWKYYDFNMKLWPKVRDNHWLFDIFGSIQFAIEEGKQCFRPYGGVENTQYWHDILEDTYAGKIDTWDYQLLFACLLQNGIHVLPNTNLVSNIGFGEQATHTSGVGKFANMPVYGMDFPLKHPEFIIRDIWADEYTQVNNFG